jgi:subtilisin-like proprotein convertase family protein
LRKGLPRCDVMEGNWRLAVGTRQEGMRGSGREEWEIHFFKRKGKRLEIFRESNLERSTTF